MNAAAVQQRALSGGVLLVLLWGASFSIQKAAYAAMGPGAYLFGRSLLMALCARALLRWRGSALWPPLARREWGLLLCCTAAAVIGARYGLRPRRCPVVALPAWPAEWPGVCQA